MDNMEEQNYLYAIDLERHPVKHTKKNIKQQYFAVLNELVKTSQLSDLVNNRLALYKEMCNGDEEQCDYHKCEDAIIKCKFQPWRNKYKLWLVCDLMLLLNMQSDYMKVIERVKREITKAQAKLVDDLVGYLVTGDEKYKRKEFSTCHELIAQIRKNREFLDMKERQIVITANMSAGKSTIINALIGKNLAHTAQEACTKNICFYHNIAFDDKLVHVKGDVDKYLPSDCEYTLIESDSEVEVATFFLGESSCERRICIMDTPGVNSSVNVSHGDISKNFIKERDYDILVYVLNGNRLGTNEEKKYLQWIYENVSENKIVFVLNKLDDFKRGEDDISESLDRVKEDIKSIGFHEPVIFPISAYFAYLLKMEQQGMIKTEDEEDDLCLLKKRSVKPEYDLSAFYGQQVLGTTYDDFLKRSGVAYLERTLFGGKFR